MISGKSTIRFSTREVLASNIRARAKRAGLPLNHLADKARISRSHLYRVLRCKSAASVDFLDSLADALGIGAWLLLRPKCP
jgi:transcriptional regulator with XRE-family HTH domain